MSPKKGRANAAASGASSASSAPVPDLSSGIAFELHVGEKDNANLVFIERIASAWELIHDHHVFAGIQTELPLGITGSHDDCGTQHPFDLPSYKKAMSHTSSYTAGMNVFWTNLQWSPTPGVPLRVSAIEQMTKTMFKEPAPINEVHIAVTGPDFNPLMHKGALLRVSPEEITSAFVLAIARDIKNSEVDVVLRTWRKFALSATGKFVVLKTATDRYWYALQQREWFSTINAAVNRTTFQRIHEISRLMKKLRETHPASEITSAAIAEQYAKNLQMTAGSSGAVTLNFVDCCATITNKLLDVPQIAWCMQDLDERQALTGTPNPFDSHSRLQAIIDKCKANNQAQLMWVMQGIWYHWRKGNIACLSVLDIKGSAATGNRGVADLLLFKHQLKAAILGRATTLFPDSANWWTNTVGSVADSFKSWFDAEEATDKSWRAGRDVHEGKLLNFFSDVVFGKLYDGAIKTAVKASKTAGDALQMPGLVEFFVDLDAKLETLKPAAVTEPSSHEEPEELDDTELVFLLPGTDATKPPSSIKASSIEDGAKREILESIVANTRQTMNAQICLISQDPEPSPHGLFAAMMETPACKLRGSPNEKDPSQSKYVGVVYDPKVSGEANHRPQLRVPPLRIENCKRLIELARGRFGQEVGDDDLPEGDLYFVLDGGKSGNTAELLKPFANKAKTVRTFTLWRDEDSMTQRLSRVKGGIGTYRQAETLLIVSASPPALKPTKFHNYKGSTAGTMIGPIIMPPMDSLWQRSWPVKKDIFTAANLIAVGGRLGDEDEEPTEKAKPRDKNTVEPVFYHALPTTFWDEILGAIPLVGLIDLCPGDGSLALAAYKRGICYTGLCMSDTHKSQLSAHLEQLIFHSMSDQNSAIYEPRLVASLQTAPAPAAAAAAAKKKANPKPKAVGEPPKKKQHTAADEQDECEDEDDDRLSGDDE